MPINLKGRSFLTLRDFTTEEIMYMLNLAKDLKAKKRMGVRGESLKGKNIVLIFDKASTRTRTAFEVATFDEGGCVTFLTNSQMGKKESIEDTAKVLGRSYDGIEYRGFSQKLVEDLAKFSGVPVWNGLTDEDHPTQVLADFLTMMENIFKPLNKMKLAFIGDTRNNMSNALMIGAAKLGMHYVAVGPQELKPNEELMSQMKEIAKQTGAVIEYSSDLKAVKGADAIYTDVWVSMGEEAKLAERVKLLTPYKVTMDLLKMTENQDVIFLHCLPSFHDFETDVARDAKEKYGFDIREVEDEVFRSKHSKVFDEAENRMHTIKAVIMATIVG
ncbi:MAG TPA: ornithine carbamoyltransferase [Petrotogaceae bacterium]|jgi:ornithine carbamoyltransferase|nr:ornithine carbamoyltransferase [Petrotogaceae bacterium]HPA92903.1 ornithine carbamoyltransferase [Petrotogaceae bacterium]HPX15897.1 ornithine carbamoyltransferase [Petrotogaceae bacterium]HQC41101.1 ornithine carbamoyltransferase [Petrotogaceae bacterium]HQP58799.1 ornithine carbamoyltransferase [Petrotogaceae bacterium]